ncbi:reverse transcriptase domain-containing protein [Methylobacterium sp. 285MFTsu5.1]|uniref:reverse transcriptase domain-containing protein n=1 Tax=Methylobacterium sp. 285MFTsu5.1 TaxID=1172187 RepID=UPI00036E5BD3|nr:reverse transcriptase domain-containing protein [Methylobacterium sp. 285MFTsu5.1]
MAGSALLKEVRRGASLERAWRVIEDNGRFSKSETVRSEIEGFRENASSKLRSLGDRLRRDTFRFPPARAVPIPKGNKKDRASFRPIVLATVEARIVQRSILGVLTEVEELKPHFRNPNSFGGIRKADGQDLAAVPAAIREVLSAIGDGATYVSCADISGFFTRISKTTVTDIIAGVVRDDAFMSLLQDAVRVELSNMAELRERAEKFPIHDIGVAQGNSLSPLLGNVILSDFDRIMNEGDCRCIRYIDDFIVLAPTRRAAGARMRLARRLLADLGMSLSPEKTHAEPRGVADGFEFLGIDLRNGLIRPSAKSQQKFITSLGETLGNGSAAFRAFRRGMPLPKAQSLLGTLRRADGAIQGWGRHYRFCNDETTFAALDAAVERLIRDYLGIYSDERKAADVDGRRALLGIESLAGMRRDPFVWPVKRKVRRTIIAVEEPTPDLKGGPGVVSAVPLVVVPTVPPPEAAENVAAA